MRTIFALVLCVALAASFATAQVVFTEDYESGNQNQWVPRAAGCTAIVADPIRPGNNVATSTCLESGGDMFTVATMNANTNYEVQFEYMGTVNAHNNGFFLGHANGNPGTHDWHFYETNAGYGSAPAPKGAPVSDGQWHSYSYTLSVTFSWHFMVEDFSGAGGVAGDIFFDNIRICLGACPTVPATPPPTLDPAVTVFCDEIADKCTALDAECTNIRNGHGPVVGAGTMPNTAGNGGVGHATGNVVLSGNSVVVTATGIISCSGSSCPNTPDGSTTPAHGSMVLPGVNQHSLIARIGAGPWQFVGAGPTTLTGTGALTFAFNDGLTSFGDNTGSWFVTIREDITNVADDCDATHVACNDMVQDCQYKVANCAIV